MIFSSKYAGLFAGTVLLVVAGSSVPSIAAPVQSGASILAGSSNAKALKVNQPSVSFSAQPISDLSIKAPSAASFSVAQAASPQVVDPAPAAPTNPAPVNIDVQSPQQLPPAEQVAPTSVEPGRATRSGSSYVGIGGNIGVLGDPSIGETGLMLYSKIGLTRYFSVRPAVTTNFVDNATFILPATFDFRPIRLGTIYGNQVSIAPYIGGGAAVNSNNGDVGPLLTAGIDVPINSRFTATAGVNAGFFNNTGLGTFLGVGYNF